MPVIVRIVNLILKSGSMSSKLTEPVLKLRPRQDLMLLVEQQNRLKLIVTVKFICAGIY